MTQDWPLRKPVCSSPSRSPTAHRSKLKRMRKNTFPGTNSNVMPCQLLQSPKSPSFRSLMMMTVIEHFREDLVQASGLSTLEESDRFLDFGVCLTQRWSCSARVSGTRPFFSWIWMQQPPRAPVRSRTMRHKVQVSFGCFLGFHAFGFDPLSLVTPAAAFDLSDKVLVCGRGPLMLLCRSMRVKGQLVLNQLHQTTLNEKAFDSVHRFGTGNGGVDVKKTNI